MTSEEGNEKIVNLAEVKAILQESLKRPQTIYEGPEEATPTPIPAEAPEEGVELAPKEDEEKGKISFEKRATMDHVTNFMKIESSKCEKMVKELLGIERVTEFHAYKIAEIMPRDETELRPVFAKERFTLEPEELKKMIEVIDKYRS